MKSIWGALAGLPPVARWGLLGLGGAFAAFLIGVGVWALLEQRAAAAERAFAPVSETYRQAVAGDQEETQLTAAATGLRQFLTGYGGSDAAARAWYYLGNVEYERGAHDVALEAFQEAVRRDAGTVGLLSRLGIGYVWEAKNEPARALEVYEAALTGQGPTDFLYGELLLATARVQEELEEPAAAIETYRRFLRDVPESPLGTDVRRRLAVLGASAPATP